MKKLLAALLAMAAVLTIISCHAEGASDGEAALRERLIAEAGSNDVAVFESATISSWTASR